MHDYPSIGQVSELAQEHAINTIFAVAAEVNRTYEAFSRLIPFADVGIVVSDASNIADLIYSKYEVRAPFYILRFCDNVEFNRKWRRGSR